MKRHRNDSRTGVTVSRQTDHHPATDGFLVKIAQRLTDEGLQLGVGDGKGRRDTLHEILRNAVASLKKLSHFLLCFRQPQFFCNLLVLALNYARRHVKAGKASFTVAEFVP